MGGNHPSKFRRLGKSLGYHPRPTSVHRRPRAGKYMAVTQAAPSTEERLEHVTTARPEHVAAARAEVVAYAARLGADETTQASVKLAVSEALTNVVIHAYARRDAFGPMTVEAWQGNDGALLVLICDEGDGMVPRPDSPGLGLGLPLIAHMADDLRVEARLDRPGTRLAMRFSLDGSGSDLAIKSTG